MEAACLPINWVLSPSIGQLKDMTFYHVSYGPSKEPIISHVLKVSDDLQCHTTIYGKTIPMYSIRSVSNVTELISLLRCVEEAVVCSGNSNPSFITNCSNRNGELCNRSGWLMLLYTQYMLMIYIVLNRSYSSKTG